MSAEARIILQELCEGEHEFDATIETLDGRWVYTSFTAQITIVSPEDRPCLVLYNWRAWTGEFEVRAHEGATFITGVVVGEHHYLDSYYMGGTLDGAPIAVQSAPLPLWV